MQASNDDPVDFIFVVAHGASPSSNVLASNLASFLKTLELLKDLWFWELKLKIHVELIDLKSVLSPFQNASLSRIIPSSGLTHESEGGQPGRQGSAKADTDAPAGAPAGAAPAESSGRPGVRGFLGRMVGKSPPNAADVDVKVQEETVGGVKRNLPAGRAETVDNVNFEEMARRHGLRVYFHNVVADVLCYLSPRYGNFMVTQLQSLINRKVKELKADKKYAQSRVVLIGHSLGSIMLYELITGDPIRETVDALDRDDLRIFPDLAQPPKVKPPVRGKCGFDFPVHAFFMWGSPLAAFLVLKSPEAQRLQKSSPFPKGVKFYNIFHRQDPVALRVEPILFPHLGSRMPPPVALPYYRTNSAAEHHAFRRDLEDVTAGRPGALGQFVKKLFVSGTFNLEAVEAEIEKLVTKFANARRYELPDPTRKRVRYGVSTSPAEAKKGSRFFFSRKGSQQPLSPGTEDRQRAALRQAAAAAKTFESSNNSSSSSANSPVPVKPAEPEREISPTFFEKASSFVIAKGDVFRRPPDPPGQLDLQPVRPLTEKAVPWTERQLALYAAKKMRGQFLKYTELKLATAEDDKTLRAKAMSVVDAEIEDFLSATVKTNPVAEPKHLPNSLGAGEAVKWHKDRKKDDLERTTEACKVELRTEFSGAISESELGGGDQLPQRIDFAVAESVPELFFAPLGLLASHLNYWSCRDTCLFMLKEVTDFRPRITRSTRDAILSRAQDSRRRIARRLSYILPQ